MANKKRDFWEWLRDYAAKKVEDRHLLRHKHTRKCPRCLVWTSETNGCHSLDELDEYTEMMTCRRCLFTSVWDCRGAVPRLHKLQYTDQGMKLDLKVVDFYHMEIEAWWDKVTVK